MKLLCSFVIVLFLQSLSFAGAMRFQCGNHTPAHATNTLEEAQRLSQLKGCTNWDVHGLFNNDSQRKRLLEILNGKGNASRPGD